MFFYGSFLDTPKTTLNYDIILHTKVVGKLKATQITKEGVTHYQSASDIEVRVIKDISVSYNYDVAFSNSFLNNANVYIEVNKKPHAKTSTQWLDTHYQIIENNDALKTVKDSITYSSIQLYFKEPVNISRCYSEQDGSFNDIIPLKNHTYKKINSKGKENYYYYENGFLKKATIEGGLIDFEISLRD
ncbi:hypothetical protein GCM10008083_17160 [Ulvibacter litoralis]|nr:hypothetical protein GCM10008083_17160 [Ulvibacter litoralis]